jgi:hypothetical protein
MPFLQQPQPTFELLNDKNKATQVKETPFIMTRYSYKLKHALFVTYYSCLSVAAGFSQVPSFSFPSRLLVQASTTGSRRGRRSSGGSSSSASWSTSTSLAVEVNGRDGPATRTFFDIDEEHHGEVCSIESDPSNEYSSKKLADDDGSQFWQALSIVMHLIPICNPVLAYFSYEILAQHVNDIVEGLSDNSWVAVDGGAYQAKIIAPAINGVVMPAISILFATLISNTVSSLRQRLLDIRLAINMESGDLRVLATMVDAFPPGVRPHQDRVRAYLIQYTSRLIAECRPGVQIDTLETGMDSEMCGVLAQLNTMSSASSSSARVVPVGLLSESYAAVTRLHQERCRRISALQSTFPSLHFFLMTMLAVSICVAFLMETNQELLIFLNSIQLRILWTMLVGTFSALGVVCYDLCDPFGGSNKVRNRLPRMSCTSLLATLVVVERNGLSLFFSPR